MMKRGIVIGVLSNLLTLICWLTLASPAFASTTQAKISTMVHINRTVARQDREEYQSYVITKRYKPVKHFSYGKIKHNNQTFVGNVNSGNRYHFTGHNQGNTGNQGHNLSHSQDNSLN